MHHLVMIIASQCYPQGVRTTISVPDPLLANAKRRAAERGVTLSRVVVDALRSHLAGAPARPRQFHLLTVRGKLADARLDLDRTSALVTAHDEAAYRRR